MRQVNKASHLSIKGIAAFTLICSAAGAYYTLMNLQTQFLRAESGVYVSLGSDPKLAWQFFKDWILFDSYNGHYTPIIFGLELVQAYLFQTKEYLWFWRQMVVAAVLFMSIVFFVRNLIADETWRSWVVSVSAATVFLFQIVFYDLLSWPFMAFQILCLSFGFLSAGFLGRFARVSHERDMVGALLCGYLAVHCFGVGLTFSIGAVASCALLTVLSRKDESEMSRRRLLLIGIFAILSIVHGLMMLRIPGASGSKISVSFVGETFGAMFLGVLTYGIQSLGTMGAFQSPNPKAFATDNIYGWAAFIAVWASFAVFMSHSRKSESASSAALIGFALAALSLYTMMLVVRLPDMPIETRGHLLFGARYIIFGSFFVFVLAATILKGSRVPRGIGGMALAIFAVGSILANATFAHTAMRSFWPSLKVSHTSQWRKVRERVRQDIESGRPVVSAPEKISGGIRHTTKALEPLLLRQLRIPSIPWAEGSK